MAFLSSDIPKFFFCFLFGISITGALFYKVESDHIQLYKLLFTIDYLRIQEIEQIWLDADIEDSFCKNNNISNHVYDKDQSNELSVEDMSQLLYNIYKQQETKLKAFYKKNYTVYQSSLLTNPLYMLGLFERFKAINQPTLRSIDQVLHCPLALRRCQNIVKQLLENGTTMTPMLLAPLNILPVLAFQQLGIRPGQTAIHKSYKNSYFSITKQEFLSMIPHLLEESLTNDLFDFLENSNSKDDDKNRSSFSYMSDDEANNASIKYFNINDNNNNPADLLSYTITTTSSINSNSGASNNSSDFNFSVSDSNNESPYYQNNNHNQSNDDRDTFDSTISSYASITSSSNGNNNEYHQNNHQQQQSQGRQGIPGYKKVNKKSRQSDVFDYMMKI